MTKTERGHKTFKVQRKIYSNPLDLQKLANRVSFPQYFKNLDSAVFILVTIFLTKL